MMDGHRRSFLQAGLGGLGVFALSSGLWPALATAAAAEDAVAVAFSRHSLAEVLEVLGASGAELNEAVQLDAAEIAENGAEVPLAARSALPDTDFLALLVANNPYKLAASFEFAAGTAPAVHTRLKLNESSEVIVLVRAGGRFYMNRRLVRVTLGGCSVDTAAPLQSSEEVRPMRIRARAGAEDTEVRILMPHVMESGLREGRHGELLPAHYITHFELAHEGRALLKARFGPSVSANPYLQLAFDGGRSGERLSLHWRDNLGQERRDEASIM